MTQPGNGIILVWGGQRLIASRQRAGTWPAPIQARNKIVTWTKRFVLAAVRFYQAALRPLNPWACKFYPSCSEYALEAVERHGLGRGSRLALGRLLRCRPGVFGGYDPVPESGTEAAR